VDQATFRSALTLIKLALDEDLGTAGDVTSVATVRADQRIRGRITAKAPGVIAGLPVVIGVYDRVDPDVRYYGYASDGETVAAGDTVCELEGRGRSILAGERTALNFLAHLSGVATMTRQFVDAVLDTNAIILDTRKTTPGWRLLEKYAVRVGGGQNHRMGLFDTVLIKDNHLDAAGGITAAVTAARNNPVSAGLPLIVEVADFDQLEEALPLKVDRILLDNMNEKEMEKAVEIVKGRVPLEASGNMTPHRARLVAHAGVNFISVGALTHSAPALDLSMRLVFV
jgi:nicotinate-nucleotide pyrophosphorylase (carboxylating)